MSLVFDIISKNNQYDAERKNTSYTFQKNLLIFYRIPLLTSDVVWATIFRDEKPPITFFSSQLGSANKEEASPRKKIKILTKLQEMLASSPSSSSSPSSIRPPQELQQKGRVRPPQEEERERLAGHTKEQKRERNNRCCVL